MLELKDLDLTKKVRSTFLNLEKAKNVYGLSKLTDTTYSYQFRLLIELEKRELIKSEKSGRERKYIFTEKGKRFRDLLYELETLWAGMKIRYTNI